MLRKPIHILVFILLALSLVACKKTEKGENKRWEAGLRTVTELSATYPSFKGALEAQKAAAEASMAEAQKVDDKKKRISAMSKANNLLSGGFVGQLSGADKRIKDLRQQLVGLGGDAKSPEEKQVLGLAKAEVEATLKAVEASLKTGAKDAASASAVMKKVDGDLEHAKKALAQVTSRVNERVQGEQKAAADKAAADKAAADKAEAAVAPWTCEYCDHQNPHDATKCEKCNAAREKK